MSALDSTNCGLVGVHAGKVVMLRAVPPMTRQEAIMLAAWLVTMAGCAGESGGVITDPCDVTAEEFAAARKAVES